MFGSISKFKGIATAMFVLVAGCSTLAALSGSSDPVVFVSADPARVLYFTDVVSLKTAITASNKLIELANADATKPIDFIINSPGGSVEAGNLLLDAMAAAQSRGIKIRCVTTVIAASMAFSMFDACSERYAMSNALLLFHPVRVILPGFLGVPISGQEAKKIADELLPIDEALIKHLVISTGIREVVLRKAYLEEKMWPGKELAAACRSDYMTVITDIKGVNGAYNYGSNK